MDGFWGYGSEHADYWFVGMEEGGGDSFEEIERRLLGWDKRGRSPLEDIYEYHLDINVPKWFVGGAPLQPTWNKLVRVLLSAKGEKPEREQVRSYQINKLGRQDGESCLLEFLPLPSPTTNHWLYGEYSQIPELVTRERYKYEIGSKRAAHLSSLIEKHQPKFVMFYGIGYLDWWRRVIGLGLIETKILGKTSYFGEKKSSKIAFTQHPVATGVKLDYFHEVGRRLA